MNYKGFLLDLDGTIYRGNELIDGAKQFIHELNDRQLPYLFVTNNSTYTRDAIVFKLHQFGISTTEEHILTSAMATANFIEREKRDAKIYFIGEEGLKNALQMKQFERTDQHCDFVVVGLDRQVTYEKLAKASLCLHDGARFISTNMDAAIPTETGLLPGNGAITSALTACTGIQPKVIGKPKKTMMDEGLRIIGLRREDVLMIGDNYHTDIQAGINAHIDTLMVLTGYTTLDDLASVPKQPTYVRENLKDYFH